MLPPAGKCVAWLVFQEVLGSLEIRGEILYNVFPLEKKKKKKKKELA